MSNAAFKARIAARTARVEKKLSEVVRLTVLSMSQRMINRSPVDTGRFRGNWQLGLASINSDTSSPPDTSGTSAMGRISRGLSVAEIGKRIYITNSLPYSRRLEYGWSQQAPQGMVRLTVAEFRDSLREAILRAKAIA